MKNSEEGRIGYEKHGQRVDFSLSLRILPRDLAEFELVRCIMSRVPLVGTCFAILGQRRRSPKEVPVD